MQTKALLPLALGMVASTLSLSFGEEKKEEEKPDEGKPQEGKKEGEEAGAPKTEEVEEVPKGQDAAEYWKKKAQENAREAQKLRGERKELTEKVKTFEDEKKTDLEKAQEKAAEAEKKAAEAEARARSASIESKAARMGFKDPDDAVKLLDHSKIEEGGTNIEALLKELLTAKPHLKGEKSTLPNGEGGNPAGGTEAAGEKAKKEAVLKQMPWLARRVAASEKATK